MYGSTDPGLLIKPVFGQHVSAARNTYAVHNTVLDSIILSVCIRRVASFGRVTIEVLELNENGITPTSASCTFLWWQLSLVACLVRVQFLSDVGGSNLKSYGIEIELRDRTGMRPKQKIVEDPSV